MNIQSISKNEKVTIDLSPDDLVMICNAMYRQPDEVKNKKSFCTIYSDMMMTRDLSQLSKKTPSDNSRLRDELL